MIRESFQLCLDGPQGDQTLPHLLNLALQLLCLGRQLDGLRTISCFQGVQIALDAFLNLPLTSLDLPRRVVTLTVIDRLELAAINGHCSVAQKFQFAAEHHEPPARVSDSLAIILAKIGNRLEVRR
jgi:hypothetical protein